MTTHSFAGYAMHFERMLCVYGSGYSTLEDMTRKTLSFCLGAT